VRESLFTKVTWLPLAIVMFRGLTALFAIVIVAASPGDGVGDGDGVPEPPPHAATRIAIDPAQTYRQVTFTFAARIPNFRCRGAAR
jgi:hypothetical protein